MVLREPVTDVLLHQCEPGVVSQVPEVLLGTGEEVVYRHHCALARDQGIHDVGRDKAGATADQHTVTGAEALWDGHTRQPTCPVVDTGPGSGRAGRRRRARTPRRARRAEWWWYYPGWSWRPARESPRQRRTRCVPGGPRPAWPCHT